MELVLKINMVTLLGEFTRNEKAITSYLTGGSYDTSLRIQDMTIEAFVALFLLMIILWVWALFLLITRWNVIPPYSKVLGILGLTTGLGPLLTIIVVMINSS